MLDEELTDPPSKEDLEKHNSTKPIWNYYETYLLRPKTKYEVIRGHAEYDPVAVAEAEIAETQRFWKDIQLRQAKECPGPNSCHGSIGWCVLCGKVGDTCDVEWPYRCDVHERRPEKPPVEKPEPINRLHPFLPGFNPREVYVKLFPQPYEGATQFGGKVWLWQYDVASKVVAGDPTTSQTMLQNCPYNVGQRVGRDTVEAISVVKRLNTWYWRLAFPILTCEACQVTDDSVEPTDSRSMSNPDDINLCRVCQSDHHSFWDEQWKDYYSGLL